MTKTLEELIERSFAIKCHFQVSSYELHHYEDGSFVDFHVQNVVNLPELIKLAGGLEMNFYNKSDSILVRLFERDTL